MTSDLLNKIKELEKENDELKIQNNILKKKFFGMKQKIALMQKLLRKDKMK